MEQADGSRLMECAEAREVFNRFWSGNCAAIQRFPLMPSALCLMGVEDHAPWVCGVEAGAESFDQRRARRGLASWFTDGLSRHLDEELHGVLVGKVVRVYRIAAADCLVLDESLRIPGSTRIWEDPDPNDQVAFVLASAREVASEAVEAATNFGPGSDSTEWVDRVAQALAAQLEHLNVAAA